jgi:peptide/nickel transport system substrate-binding protein
MAQIQRRRFLKLAATSAAASFAIACGGAPPAPTAKPADTAAKPAEAPKPADAPKPAAAEAKPAAPTATTAALQVQQQQVATPVPTAATSKYKEAPQLAQLVKDGKLPAVDMRLPAGPRVIKPMEETGQYGGTWHRAWKGLADRLAVGKLMEERLIEWDAPDTNTLRLVPNFIEKWDQSPDAKEFTFYLRKGIKWSDGVEVTTDDVKFWIEDVEGNKDIRPAPSQVLWQNVGTERKSATITVVDKYTWKAKYEVPNPLLPIWLAKNSGQGAGFEVFPAFFAPSHYLKKFHAKYTDKAALDKMATDQKLTGWVELWGKGGQLDGPIGHYVRNPDLPTVAAWKASKVPPVDPIVMERNPFYWQVDDQGNQLPYVDAVEHLFFEDTNVFKLWITQGKIDLQNRHVESASYTFFKENESKGGYRVLNWRSASTNTYFPSINARDPVLAKLFEMPEVRQAMNLAVNRKEISDVVFNGLLKPRQYGPIKGSPEYDEGMEQAWAQYDVAKANQLLDTAGLKKGADGVRVRPDGKPFEVTILHSTSPGAAENDQHELVRKYWTAVGIKASVKAVDRAFYMEEYRNGRIEVGYWGWDRASVNKADPGRWTAIVADGPWAPTYGQWYNKDAFLKEEPPKDHWIRKIWELWEKTQQEPDDAKRDATFMEIIKLHRNAPVAVGVVGEAVSPWIVKSNFRNVKAGYINDDTLRDYGLINPQQFFFKK